MAFYPKVASDIPVTSGQNWSLGSPNGSGGQYCLYADDGVYATANITALNPFKSDYLKANKYDVGVPAGSGYKINGFIVTINRYSDGGMSSTSSISDWVVQLVDSGGNLVGQNKALSGLWPLSLTTQTYGSVSDDWSTGWGSLSDGGVSMVNASGFGVILQINEAAGGVGQDTGRVDSITMQVFFSASGTKFNSSFPLFIAGIASGNANIPLFIDGGSSISGSIPLYTKGLASGNASIPLFLDVATPFSGSIPLYIDGGPHVSNCYNFPPSSPTTICNSQDTSWVNTNNVLLLDNSRTTCTMTSGDARSCQLLTYFNLSGISTQAQVSGIIFTVYKQQNVGDDSVIDEQLFLIEHGIVQSGVNYAGGIWGTDSHVPVQYTITKDQNGAPLQISDLTASGFGVLLKAGTNNFGAGTAQIDYISATICATVPGFAVGFPLFLSVTNSGTNSLTLYIDGQTSISGNFPLYIDGQTSISGNFPLFIDGQVSISGNFPLYLQCNNLFSGSIPLYTAGTLPNSGQITLFLKGDPVYSIAKSFPLFMSVPNATGVNSFNTGFPLFLDSHNFGGGITLYLGVSNIGSLTNVATLYTIGGAFNLSNSIPLFLNNSGTSLSMPLYTKGLSLGTNPFVNSDGYYPKDGSITLYLAQKQGNNSIPLYLASSQSGNWNIPLFIQNNNTFSGSIPLFISPFLSNNNSIPLYHHGF